MKIDVRVKIVLRVGGPRSTDCPRLFGMTTYPRAGKFDARVWVNLRRHYRVARKRRRGLGYMIEEVMRTLDHEYVHALLPDDESREEALARRFERAGAWARR